MKSRAAKRIAAVMASVIVFLSSQRLCLTASAKQEGAANVKTIAMDSPHFSLNTSEESDELPDTGLPLFAARLLEGGAALFIIGGIVLVIRSFRNKKDK